MKSFRARRIHQESHLERTSYVKERDQDQKPDLFLGSDPLSDVRTVRASGHDSDDKKDSDSGDDSSDSSSKKDGVLGGDKDKQDSSEEKKDGILGGEKDSGDRKDSDHHD